MNLVWQTQNIKKKCVLVILPKLCKEACSKGGNLNIFFNEINKIEHRSSEYVIVKDGISIMPKKEDCN